MSEMTPAQKAIFTKNEQGTQKSSHEIIMEKVMDEAFSTHDIEMKTELSAAQIKQIVRGVTYAERYESPTMASLVANISIYNISKDRAGRKEWIELTRQFARADDEEQMKSQNLWNHLLKGG